MDNKIKLDDVSLDAAVANFSAAFEDTIAAAENFIDATSSNPYDAGSSAAANPLSSFMTGLTIDYLSPLKNNLTDLLVAIPSAAICLKDQDSALAHPWENK